MSFDFPTMAPLSASTRRSIYLFFLACLLAKPETLAYGFSRPDFSIRKQGPLRSGSNSAGTSRPRRRDRVLKKLGITPKGASVEHEKKSKAPKPRYVVTEPKDLDAYFEDEQRRFRNDDGEIDYNALLKALDVRGDTQVIGDPNKPEYTHPTAQILHERKRAALEGRPRSDNAKIALSVEGGGMRGCITGGMVCAIHHLNLTNCFDVVYGSSAGTVVGSYLLTEQVIWSGPEVYYDALTSAGREFIDSRRLLRALGYGLLDPRLLKDVLTRPDFGKPVLNLPYLLEKTLQTTKPLDWEKFVERQKTIPLKIVVSDLKDEKAIAMDMDSGYFDSLAEMAKCMHASCLLPGIAGPVMNMDTRAVDGDKSVKKYFVGNAVESPHIHPLADALVYEPLPFHSAVEEGATHVVVLRSRPDGVDVTGKSSIFERMISKRFFLRKNNLPKIYQRMRKQLHKKLYAQDVLELNEEAYSTRSPEDTSEPHLLAVAAPPGTLEIGRLELRREVIFQGMRDGFARAYDCLVEDPAERGRGVEVAKEFFPDEILTYDPLEINSGDESAYAHYKRMKEAATHQ